MPPLPGAGASAATAEAAAAVAGSTATTIDGLLAEHAAAFPDKVALALPRGRGFRTTTYARLDARVSAVAAGLAAAGLHPGMRTALLVPPTEDFFVLAFALLRLRTVPVLLDPGIGRDNMKGCLAEVAPVGYVGIAKAQLARRVLGWAPSARIVVSVGVPAGGRTLRRVEDDGRWRLPFTPPERPAGSPAAIVFTSGSTGPPKGVEHDDAGLLAQARSIAALYDLTPDDVSLSTFPPFALYGPALGMTTVVPRMDPTRPADVNPARVVDAANRFGATVMFGSPALLDTLSRGGGRMPTLRRVISAGAPVPRRVQRRTLAMLAPGGQVHTPYGATEALPVASIGSDELLALPEDGICVGRPVPGVHVALVRVTDEPMPELTGVVTGVDEVGEVVVRGMGVSRAYAERPVANAAAKTLWDGVVGHRMGDLASRDAEGRLWFAGRKAHVVHTARGPLYSVPCEEVFNAHEWVRRSALVGVELRAGTAAGRSEPDHLAPSTGRSDLDHPSPATGRSAPDHPSPTTGRSASSHPLDSGPGKPESSLTTAEAVSPPPSASPAATRAMVPVLVVELEPGREPSAELTRELLGLGAAHPRTQSIARVLFHPGLPVDIRHNSKIDRPALGIWAATQS